MQKRELIEKLNKQKTLSKDEFIFLLNDITPGDLRYAAVTAREIADRHFGKRIYIRGIIEFSNYCKNNCYYCGIRCGNKNAVRYRLDRKEILNCCRAGYKAGFRTFVLQSGEDLVYTDEMMCDIIKLIKLYYPDCAVTLSVGEKSAETYQKWFDAGADRYLLRHETADVNHYKRLHPPEMSFENRMECLKSLKKIGYQTGCGCMVGTPFQTVENLADDLVFMSGFKPQMVGIGPFIPHRDTPFKDQKAGSVNLTLYMLSLTRIMLEKALIPATTALGSVTSDGRKRGVLAGANVIMPNLSPVSERKKYTLYDNKAITGDDAAESVNILDSHMKEIGYHTVTDIGNYSDQ